MRSARSVLLVLMLLAGSLSPPGARSQEMPRGSPPERGRGFSLEQNYPSLVNPETWIPFTLDASLFETRDTVTVSLRIYTALGQMVAVAVADEARRQGKRVPLLNHPFTEPGRKLAYWNATDGTGRRVPSGLYIYELAVGDMRPRTLRMVVNNPERKRRFFPWFGH